MEDRSWTHSSFPGMVFTDPFDHPDTSYPTYGYSGVQDAAGGATHSAWYGNGGREPTNTPQQLADSVAQYPINDLLHGTFHGFAGAAAPLPQYEPFSQFTQAAFQSPVAMRTGTTQPAPTARGHRELYRFPASGSNMTEIPSDVTAFNDMPSDSKIDPYLLGMTDDHTQGTNDGIPQQAPIDDNPTAVPIEIQNHPDPFTEGLEIKGRELARFEKLMQHVFAVSRRQPMSNFDIMKAWLYLKDDTLNEKEGAAAPVVPDLTLDAPDLMEGRTEPFSLGVDVHNPAVLPHPSWTAQTGIPEMTPGPQPQSHESNNQFYSMRQLHQDAREGLRLLCPDPVMAHQMLARLEGLIEYKDQVPQTFQ